MFPSRISACTYNIWTDTRWPERAPSLEAFARLVSPDVLCLQEVRPASLAVLDGALTKHQRVRDSFEGWATEGNIYWRDDLFQLDDFGAEEIGILEPLRRLFWVRLRPRDERGGTVVVATAHYTWHGHAECKETEKNVRIEQARRTVDSLAGIVRANERCLFMGDLNDSNEPILVLRDAGFVDCFSALGQHSAATYPAAPTASGVPQTIDWLMAKGPISAVLAHVVDFYDGDLAPSDHKPVMAVFEFHEGRNVY